MSPCSTYGRKASCCALLKRCTSSTKRIVRRPNCSRRACAAATASRMSLTPEKTADSATNSALNAFAIRRAMVVLPEPGGPHRIIECGRPDSKAKRSGVPGPSRCSCPTTSSSVFGRSASASGATGSALPKRSAELTRFQRGFWRASFFPEDVGPLGRVEAELGGIDLRVAFELGKAQLRGLAEIVGELHRLQAARVEAEKHTLEARVALARLGLQPFEAVLFAGVGERERLLDAARTRQQRRRRRAERGGELPYRHLVELPVVDPDALAVTDDHLVGRLVIYPAK